MGHESNGESKTTWKYVGEMSGGYREESNIISKRREITFLAVD